ncbi:MAG: L-seryl-tRNA(Sec) selenium transferase [Planctomycetota bacterium]
MTDPVPATNPFRLLPSVDQLVAAADGLGLARPLATLLAKRALESLRARIAAGEWDAAGFAAFVERGGVLREIEDAAAKERRAGIARVVNATGVVLNTGLGRAPVHPEAAERMAEVARSYCVLEVDRDTNQRNQRDDRISELTTRLVGGEAAICVNNCAAAVLLALQTFAGGKECVVSRGELVEIGGSFRMPAVMERAGVKLVEVGTTNRTRAADFEGAIRVRTGLLLKVHTSNYRVVGFTEECEIDELARIGASHRVPVVFDLGSGLIDPDGATPLDFLDEHWTVTRAIASGCDAVTFSGDKLFGGPQAGFVVGKRDAIRAMRKNPLYRALRLDKSAIAGLERTLELMLEGRGDELPARRMLVAKADELRPLAERLAAEIGAVPGFAAEVVAERSQPGSGSAPHVFLDTFCVAVSRGDLSTERLARTLREGEPPVFARINGDRLLLDVRTLLPGDDAALAAAFRNLP